MDFQVKQTKVTNHLNVIFCSKLRFTSMQNKHSSLEHEMKFFLRHWLRSQKKWWPCEHTRFLKYPRWNSGTVPMPEYKDELGYTLGTGKTLVIWHFFTQGAFRSSQEVVETCPCVPEQNGIWKCFCCCCCCWGGGKSKYTEKTSRSKDENQHQPQPTYMYGVDARIRTRITLMGGECSHHCATPHFCWFWSSPLLCRRC